MPDLEQRISDIQAQLNRLSAAVELPAEDREHVALMESRLSLLTQQCAEILDRWTLTDLRHTRALGEMETRLGHWESLETRVEQEWLALRHMLEQPVRQLQEHAASLRETSVATAGSALTGLERAETRLATIQADLSDRMGQLSRDVQAVVAELRGGTPRSGPPASAGMPAWPLDQVMRIHNEVRETEGDVDQQPDLRSLKTITLLPQTAASLSERIESVEHEVAAGKDIVRETFERADNKRRSSWRAGGILLVMGLIVAVAFTVRLQRQIEAAAARISAAESEVEVARTRAESQIEAGHKDAERQIAQARETAHRAQVVSEVLAASDLVRYGLSGGETAQVARGQVLWSRSRGVVFSGSRVPQPPSGSTYQLWLLTNSGAVSVGLATPDSEGRVSLATDTVPAIPRPVVGVALTREPTGGVPAPSGTPVLRYRAPQDQPQ